MKLYAALGAAMLFTMGPGEKMKAAWANVLQIAESLGDTDYALRALWGVWAASIIGGDARSRLKLAQRFLALAAKATDPFDMLIGERMLGVSLHYQGDQANARRHNEGMLSRYVAPVYRSDAIIRFQFDQRIAARSYHARILWLLGLPDQAMGAAQRSIDEAEASGHALSLCYALLHAACPVALFTGDLAAADRFATMLVDASVRAGLNVLHAMGRCFRGMLLIKRGDFDTGSRLLRATIDELGQSEFALIRTGFLCALAEGLAGAGQIAEGLGTIDDALARCERFDERWYIAELLRVKGELELHSQPAAAPSVAEGYFLQSIDWARRQSALSWELRAATSLARLRHQQNRITEARGLLAPVYDRFTEGFETADLRGANALLEAMG
jgi:predicted ATPase